MVETERGAGGPPGGFAGGVWAAAALALASALASAWPPEVDPETGPVVALLLVAGLLALPRPLPRAAVLGSALLIAFNLAVSVAPGRSLETAARLALPAAALGIGWLLPRRRAPLVLSSIGAVGAGLGALAVAQRAGLLRLEAEAAREVGLPALVVARLAENRPFATHLLPAALAGALAVALAALLAQRARGTSWGWIGPAVALVGMGLVATGSLGALVGLVAGALVALPWRRVVSRRAALAALLIALAGTTALVALRPGPVFDLARPEHPIALRAGNWRGAVLVALRQPFAGDGLGSFASLYPAVRRPGDVETLYAHNSWLQLAAEAGLPAILLLALAGRQIVRRARSELPGDQRWALAGAAAFAAHNLVDFTAYLPGVAVPAMALAGLAFSPDAERDTVRDRAPGLPGAANLLGALLLATFAALLAGDAMARRGLERAEAAFLANEREAAATAALDAARAAPFSTSVPARAAALVLAADGESAAARRTATALAAGIAWRDAESPAGWRLLGEAALRDGRGADAWRYLSLAQRRHPADAELSRRVEALEASFRAAGMLESPLGYGGDANSGALPRGPSAWESLLLAAWLLAAGLVALAWLAPRVVLSATPEVPPEAVAVALCLLLAPWGEGAALPGPLLGRAALLSVGLVAALWPRTRAPGRDTLDTWPAGILAWFPLLSWAGVTAALAPDEAASRDGWLALAWGIAVLALSWRVSVLRPRWPRLVVGLLGIVGASVALLALIQRGALLAGLGVAHWPPPFGLSADGRPAADFLHAGHLGTFLVAAGLASAASALPSRDAPLARGRFLLGAALIAVGLASGARATLLALVAGGTLLVIAAAGGAARRVAFALATAGLAVGAAAVAWRFSHGDPYAFTRLSIWRAGLGALADRPLLGFGPGGFSPLAASYAFPEETAIARYARSFSGPHSDLLGLLLAVGIAGAVLALAALLPTLRRGLSALRAACSDEAPWLLGLAAALAAFAAHALVDDLFGSRPAAAIAAATLLGALAGRVVPADRRLEPAPALRAGITLVAVVALLGGELMPWAADRARWAGEPAVAATLDPARASYEILAARAAVGPPPRQLATALDRTARAVHDSPASAATHVEEARVLQAACVGPLPTEDTCRAAIEAWKEGLARRPYDVQARRARARLLAAAGRLDEAGQELERALADEPNYLAARLDLSRVRAEMGDREGARLALEETRRRIASLEGVRPENAWTRQILTLTREERQALEAAP